MRAGLIVATTEGLIERREQGCIAQEEGSEGNCD